MGYSNHFSGEITITPPLQLADLIGGPDLTDVQLRAADIRTVSDDGNTETLTRRFDAIVPRDESYSGHRVEEDIQAVLDHYGPLGRTFAGHIEVQFEAGLVDVGDPGCERYVVTDGRVETVTPRLVWPGEDDELLADARALAMRCGEVLRQMPTSISELLDVDFDDLPGWFFGYDNGREIWGGA